MDDQIHNGGEAVGIDAFTSLPFPSPATPKLMEYTLDTAAQVSVRFYVSNVSSTAFIECRRSKVSVAVESRVIVWRFSCRGPPSHTTEIWIKSSKEFSHEECRMAEKHLKKCSISFSH